MNADRLPYARRSRTPVTMVRRSLIAALVLSAAPVATADANPKWILMPVYAPTPPPGDPTLLRMSKRIGEALAEHNAADVRLVSRELREERCQDHGHECPDAIARMLEVDRVIAVELAEDYGELLATVFDPPNRARSVRVPCKWVAGGPSCDVDGLAKEIAEATKPTWDPAAADAAFDALRTRIDACLAQEKGGADPESRVTFRIREDGRPIEVRIQPKALQRKKAYRCVARVVESLRVPPFVADRMPFLNKPLVTP